LARYLLNAVQYGGLFCLRRKLAVHRDVVASSVARLRHAVGAIARQAALVVRLLGVALALGETRAVTSGPFAPLGEDAVLGLAGAEARKVCRTGSTDPASLCTSPLR
jgi:hypothetical protein